MVSFVEQIHIKCMGKVGIMLLIVAQQQIHFRMTEGTGRFFLQKDIFHMLKVEIFVQEQHGLCFLRDAQFNGTKRLFVVFGKIC